MSDDLTGPKFKIPGGFGGGFQLKCRCSCWYCLCTRDGHCGGEKCGHKSWHPEEHTLEEFERQDRES